MTTLFYRPAISEFEALFRQIDEIFEGTVRPAAALAQPAEAPAWKPRAAVQEWGDRYEVRFQLPGINPAELEIEARRDLITVKGDRKAPAGTPIHSELRYGAFERRLRLPEEIQPEHVSATYEQGILTLALPKLSAAENYRVKVAIASPVSEEPVVQQAAQQTVEPEPVW